MDDRNTEVNTRKKKKRFIRFEETILFEDERVVVANKPQGISSAQGRDPEEIHFARLAQRYDPELRLCHRLDKMTSGVLLFARGPEVYRHISMQFEHREVAKHYVAVVHGVHDFKEFVIDLPLSDNGKGQARVNYSSGKEAITVVDTAEVFTNFTLVDCHPLTGRMHQIRIHLSAAGAPVAGDLEYGGRNVYLSDIKPGFKFNRKEEEPPVNEGYLLHSRGISIVLPGDSEPSTFVAPLSEKFDAALKILRKYAKG